MGLTLSVSPSPQQNVMLDLSKRSRSGKFRLVTKFKKEKINKNKEAYSSLGAPGTCPSPACFCSCQQSRPLILLASAFTPALRPFPMVPVL